MVAIQFNVKVLLMLLVAFKVHLACSFSVAEVFSKFWLSFQQQKQRNIDLSLINSSSSDSRLLSDLWFLRAGPQDALNSPYSRSCIYPFSYYHLHGIFQFFTYGIFFPFGYLVGRHGRNLNAQRPIHLGLQVFKRNKRQTLIYFYFSFAFVAFWRCVINLWLCIRCSLGSCTCLASFSTCTRNHRYNYIHSHGYSIFRWIVSIRIWSVRSEVYISSSFF